MRHHAIAMAMSVGAGLLLAGVSLKLAADAIRIAGPVATALSLLLGAAVFSASNALLARYGATHRKRCGECIQQPAESQQPGSGVAISLGNTLGAVPSGPGARHGDRPRREPPRAVVERGPDRPGHESDALDKEPVRARRRQPQRLQRMVLLRIVPALGRLETRELENHRKRRLRTLHDVELPAGDEDASVVLLNRGQDALAVLPHLGLIGHLEYVEHCIRWHGRLLVGTVRTRRRLRQLTARRV